VVYRAETVDAITFGLSTRVLLSAARSFDGACAGIVERVLPHGSEPSEAADKRADPQLQGWFVVDRLQPIFWWCF
jgi:hypothetical protein